ncbi:hypothetical protein AYR66_06530 [Noviherbaspirillum denitrificans]|uniref:Uncharacterized protein n=1 Tax=Noviherbaspirillum denitrificans TaxID=1968433 RepID=A0A254TAM3_9BURK|nr:hypothetical protein AYR66_06530 [Noviherbaspirillum denitrificans]
MCPLDKFIEAARKFGRITVAFFLACHTICPVKIVSMTATGGDCDAILLQARFHVGTAAKAN